VKALRLLFVFAASLPERVAASVLTTDSAALPVVKSIGPLAFSFFRCDSHSDQRQLLSLRLFSDEVGNRNLARLAKDINSFVFSSIRCS
jgi:hypothetical protein